MNIENIHNFQRVSKIPNLKPVQVWLWRNRAEARSDAALEGRPTKYRKIYNVRRIKFQSLADSRLVLTLSYPNPFNPGVKPRMKMSALLQLHLSDCPTCRTTLIATRFWVVMICPIIKCLTVLEFSFILFDLCLFITIINFILNYVPIVTFLIFTYHKIWILLIIFCFIWSYWIIYFLTCLEVFWSVVS